jgi:hypothetical protein
MEPKNIYTKLLEFQKQNIVLPKDATNPHFKNSYSSINAVLEAVKKPLNDLGVVIIQRPTIAGLETVLYDAESGTSILGTLEFTQKTDAQKMGSNITYNRRYSLITMLGLEDEDDDGNKAAGAREEQLPTINRR